MPYISKEERKLKAEKIFKSATFRKVTSLVLVIFSLFFCLWILLTCLFTLLYAPYVHKINSFIKFFCLADLIGSSDGKFDFKKQPGWINVIIITIMAFFLAILQLTLFFIDLTFQSPKKVASEAIELASIPTGGKQPRKFADKLLERLNAVDESDKKEEEKKAKQELKKKEEAKELEKEKKERAKEKAKNAKKNMKSKSKKNKAKSKK